LNAAALTSAAVAWSRSEMALASKGAIWPMAIAGCDVSHGPSFQS
jgi:hypothetical protein